jgi:hypothetical protein
VYTHAVIAIFCLVVASLDTELDFLLSRFLWGDVTTASQAKNGSGEVAAVSI